MADLLILTTRGDGLRYQDIENPEDVWTFLEPAPATLPERAIPYERLGALGDVATPAPFLYTVELDVADEHLPEVYRWYEEEHLPLLTACPGCRGGARYRRLDGGRPNLLAAYRFERPEANATSEWIAARSTPWTERMRAHFRAQRRYVRKLVS